MAAYREIRADYDRETIVVYQAYNEAIAVRLSRHSGSCRRFLSSG